MSQEAVELVLGKLLTDARFRRAATDSFEGVCLREGYGLTKTELRLISRLELPCFTELAGRLDLSQIPDYDRLGCGKWAYVCWPLPVVPRLDIMPSRYRTASVTKKTRLLNFFSMTDIHLTGNEAPNKLIYLQQSLPGYAGQNSSSYSGAMLYTPQVFDAAIQTANALHKQDPFDLEGGRNGRQC